MYDYELVRRKIKLLYQLGHLTYAETSPYMSDNSAEDVLHNNKKGRPYDIARMLYGKNETQIDNWAHDIIVGNKTLDEKLYGGITL